MTLTLFMAPGSCSRVPLIALEEIGAPFETRLIAFMAGEHRSSDYLTLNPAGKVPALIVEGGVITQNVAILRYLAARFPDAHVLPSAADPLAEALLVAQLLRFSADLHPLVTRLRMPFLICDLPEGIGRVSDLASATMATQLAPTERVLQNQAWLLGDRWSVLDAYLSWIWFRISGTAFDTSPFPAIAEHYTRAELRPSAQRALAREHDAEAQLTARGLMVPLR